ncbi:bifunctional glutamate N-acetyltransferase/amino-acid acetyltransferase ArgJ [soil metagenome]
MSVTAPGGFVAAGVPCGIKASGAPDLALVATSDGVAVPAAAVFTSNLMTAATVLATRAHLDATGSMAAAVILNSGNANAATGAGGRADAERMCALTAAALGCRAEEVLVCSTGLIGIPMPMAALDAGIPALVAGRRRNGGFDAADAIRTTDTCTKEVAVDGDGFTVGGMAKGAAMLAPDMATMLAVLTTDASADHDTLQRTLHTAVAGSFNALTIDGWTSTNDTVILLASGVAGPVAESALAAAVSEACTGLAGQMVGDAEGATKVVRLQVTGAADDGEAARAARKVAESQLVKCSWYGQDPYWGRIASELGSAGVAFHPDRLVISYGGVVVCRGGVTVDHDEGAVRDHLAGRHLEVTADLGLGAGQGRILTNDLTHAYVDENMGRS